ncbi:uncharacterized protein N0V89_008390 [Didymosphaeria variabile]|uniref:Uncharacterized protein n=1 Tax=Didymosphaeria variabile TaxID=1932322 RepID=A0A9W8XHG4_9PLEO|nr:uncharacterized protein N0V89_008390 [Didymosphaeria variabile]KAJ4349772.1 hypothetical protein N0V89_008390 [Didymosphaeria variabile]
MISLMPPESANSSPGEPSPEGRGREPDFTDKTGANYWYGGSLPNGLSNSLDADPSNPRMLRRASEAPTCNLGKPKNLEGACLIRKRSRNTLETLQREAGIAPLQTWLSASAE